MTKITQREANRLALENAAEFVDSSEDYAVFGELTLEDANIDILNKAREYAARRIRKLIRYPKD